MKRHYFIVSLSLFLLLSGQSVFAGEVEPCRKACENAEVSCRAQADVLPNELDKNDAYRVCEEEIVDCSNGCTPDREKEERERLEKIEQEKAAQEKAQQEKAQQEQQYNEKNGFVPLENLKN
jgi:hypothetical protein